MSVCGTLMCRDCGVPVHWDASVHDHNFLLYWTHYMELGMCAACTVLWYDVWVNIYLSLLVVVVLVVSDSHSHRTCGQHFPTFVSRESIPGRPDQSSYAVCHVVQR